MNEKLVQYADVVSLLHQWRAHQKKRDVAEFVALQQCDQARLVTAMRTMLAYAELELRFAVADALPFVLPDDMVVDLLIPYLTDPSPEFRWTLCEILHGYPDPRVVLPLTQVLLEDREPDVRLIAAEALHAVGDARAIPALSHAARHDHGKDYEDRAIARAARDAIAAIQRRMEQKLEDKYT
jgi:hypothetical protein